MNKPTVLLITALVAANCSQAQAGLIIPPITPFFITAGTDVSIDGLVLQPSADFTIGAPNELALNTTVANTATGSYISRVYKWTNTLSSFTGNIAIYYLDSELNGIRNRN